MKSTLKYEPHASRKRYQYHYARTYECLEYAKNQLLIIQFISLYSQPGRVIKILYIQHGTEYIHHMHGHAQC